MSHRHRDREREIESYGTRDRTTDRDTHRVSDMEIGRDRWKGGVAHRPAVRPTEIDMETGTHRHRDRWTERLTEQMRQPKEETEKLTQRESESDRDRERKIVRQRYSDTDVWS